MRIDRIKNQIRCWLILITLPVALAAAGGCGEHDKGTINPDLATLGPHGAPALPLGDKGFAEVLVEPLNPTAKRAAGAKMVLAVYFLQPDLKTNLAEPTGVSATIITPEAPEPEPVALTAKPYSGRNPGPGLRFASAVGKFDYDELQGELTATVSGESFTKKFRFR